VFPKGKRPRPVRGSTAAHDRAVPRRDGQPGGWERDTAQMLLQWNRQRHMPEAKGELSGVVYGSQNALAGCRRCARWKAWRR